MATGDVQGSVERLRSELRHIRYPADLDCTGAKLGVAAAFLPVLNYVLLKFSRHVAHQLVSAGYELQGKTDARFIEAAFKVFRDKFGLRPVLTAPQFLEQGFAERKLMLVSDVIAYCKSFHNAAVRRARLAAASAPTKSGKDGTISGKAAASQLSKGSLKSKAKSGLPRAPPQPRVQRHSDAVSEADTAAASAAAALQARLGPSSAQLAHVDQSQNIDPNPWGPSAHALGALSMQTGHPQASHGMAAVPMHGPYDKLSQSVGHLPAQQQHMFEGQSQSRAQGKTGSMPAATQAWFVSPAFGSESPMPSPEKQPRSQGPPMPHPSTYPGRAGPQHPTGISAQQQSLSAVSGQAAVQQASPQQHSQDASRSMSFGAHLAHDQQQATGYMSMHPPYSAGLSGHPHHRLHQQELHRVPAAASLPVPFEPSVQADGKHASSHDTGQALNATGYQLPQQQHLHRRHVFPSMPARQQQQQQSPQQADTSGLQYQAITQRPATAGYSHTSAPSLPPHARQPPMLPHQGPHQHLVQHHRLQEGHSDGQLQGQLLHQLQGQTMSELQQQQSAQQQQQPGGGRLSGVDMGAYVQGLHQRLAAAEEQAAQARQHGERQVHTLEARITLLEGRLTFVEGELAAERHRSAAAAQAGDSGAQRSAEIAVCLSPPAAKARQDKAAAGLAAPHAVSKPPMTTPHRCMGVEASPTRSTAGTPCYGLGKVGVSRQLGLSALAQQSPARSIRAPAAPASPASSMHSYKSTSELIESIQNRYLEAQSFLKSYKL